MLENESLLFPFPEEEKPISSSPILTLDRLANGQLAADVAQLIMDGGVVVYPTDTVYGLGVSAFNRVSYDKLYQLKGRDHAMPISFLVSEPTRIFDWALVSDLARSVMSQAWPGALTLVLPASASCPSHWKSADGDVAFRYIDSPALNHVIHLVGGALTSTSANLSGQSACNTIQDAYRTFESRVDLYVDAGNLRGQSSTVLKIRGNESQILREGAISKEQISQWLHV